MGKPKAEEGKMDPELSLAKYSEEERDRIGKYAERCSKKPVLFKTVKSSSGKPNLMIEEQDEILGHVKMMEAFGTPHLQLQNHLLNQAIQTFRGSTTSEGLANDGLVAFSNNAMALLAGIQPRDEIEGMLAIQMIGVHNIAMDCLKRAMIVDQTFEGVEANVNRATKMLRTFAMQTEALKKYRSGGQQKVTVEHVNVNKGGQAIVGTVNQGGGGICDKKSE
jgi:hypothetical protein